jgi:hypothetical protein
MALHRGLYIAIIIDRYEGPQTPLTIALLGRLSLANIMDLYEESQTALKIALYGDFT